MTQGLGTYGEPVAEATVTYAPYRGSPGWAYDVPSQEPVRRPKPKRLGRLRPMPLPPPPPPTPPVAKLVRPLAEGYLSKRLTRMVADDVAGNEREFSVADLLALAMLSSRRPRT